MYKSFIVATLCKSIIVGGLRSIQKCTSPLLLLHYANQHMPHLAAIVTIPMQTTLYTMQTAHASCFVFLVLLTGPMYTTSQLQRGTQPANSRCLGKDYSFGLGNSCRSENSITVWVIHSAYNTYGCYSILIIKQYVS